MRSIFGPECKINITEENRKILTVLIDKEKLIQVSFRIGKIKKTWQNM